MKEGMDTLQSIYEKAKKAHSMCRDGTLRISEAEQITEEIWADLKSLYPEDSIEWRKVDSVSSKTMWWTAPGPSEYAKQNEVTNLNTVIQVIESITGKTRATVIDKKQKPKTKDNHHLSRITGRTQWDFLSELHRHYKLWFIIIAVALLLYLGWP